MSNKKKPKKLRTPNVPGPQAAIATAPMPPPSVRSAGQPLPSPARQMRAVPAAATAQANFDYTYVKKDLGRIGILAGSFIVILVVLSLFIH
jgi:hypothetical protein